MNDELTTLLASSQDLVDKKRVRREQNIEKYALKYYNKVKGNKTDFNTELAKMIIEDYLKWKERAIFNLENEKNHDFYINSRSELASETFSIDKYGFNIYGLISYCSSSLSFDDQNAIRLLNQASKSDKLETILEANEEQIVYQFDFDEKKRHPFIFNQSDFNNLGINITFTEGDMNDFYQERIGRVKAEGTRLAQENFVKQAAINNLGPTIQLDDEYVLKLKERLGNITTTHEILSLFRYKSNKNADIISLDLCKEYLRKYKNNSAGIKPDKLLHANRPVCTGIKQIKSALNKDDLFNFNLLLKRYKDYSYTIPTIYAIPCDVNGKVK